MIKVMTVFGTRPEAIKMAPLVKELESCEKIKSIVCVTAQHRQMLDQVLKLFEITPDYDLNIMKEKQTLTGITTRVLEGLGDVLKSEKPNIVLVHGDTSTTFAGALAAFYNQIDVGHVEAGLRTFDKYSPYPEEMNRRLTGVLTDLHLAPTGANKKNLLNENINEKDIFITGNTVIDSLKTTVRPDYVFESGTLRALDWSGKRIIVMTAHRRENLGAPLEAICRAALKIAEKYEDTVIVYPVHLNPAVRETAIKILGGHERIHLIDPLGVQDLHNAISRCFMVMTDSGGLQEEAPSLGKPVLVLRKETERPEAVVNGTVKIAGVNEEDIVELSSELLEDKKEYEKMARATNPYGDGNASKRIVSAILYKYGASKNRPEDFEG